MAGKQRLQHTPFLDAWRLAFLAATGERPRRVALATFLHAQGRITRQSVHNLLAALRTYSRTPTPRTSSPSTTGSTTTDVGDATTAKWNLDHLLGKLLTAF